MGYARKNLVSLQDTPYYHCVARCVRRAWLWGVDEYAGKDYSHRKDWVIERLAQQSAMFAVEVCAYAVMSNHYHLVLYVDAKRARHWTNQEVLERWQRLFVVPTLVQRWKSGEVTAAERQAAEVIIERWRSRLYDISWFMRCLNEHLARLANAEDNCTGRFWEGRFKSQALLDEAGLLTAMAYVDLNPVRAGVAKTPEDSTFTSIRERIKAARSATSQDDRSVVSLRAFKDHADQHDAAIPYTLREYLVLVDWSGRLIRNAKRGAIEASLPPILHRLGIEADSWELLMRHRGTLFGRAMGKLDVMRLHAATLGQSWVRGMRTAQRLYGN